MIDVSIFMRSEGWPTILKVKKVLDDSGIEAYIVGGWVRDTLLGKDTGDFDFAVAADGLQIAASVAEAFGGTYVPLDEVNRVGRIVLTGEDGKTRDQRTLDFAGYQGTITDDLARRDFTIDSMAIGLKDVETDGRLIVIDPFNGLDDLKNKLVRATSESCFIADPVRLLRAVRLAASLGFAIEPATEDLVQRDAQLVSMVAGERVREELLLLLSTPGSGRRLSDLQGLGLLTAIFPEMETTRGHIQPKEHHWDVLQHSLMTAVALDFLVRQGAWDYSGEDAIEMIPWSAELDAYFRHSVGHGSDRTALFRLAALFHDIAKPQTRSVEPGGKVRFLGHAQQGAAIAAGILTGLRFSTKEVKLVETAVKYHLRPTQMGWPEMPTRRAIYRYCRDTGDAAIGILFLSMADHLATRGPALDPSDWATHAAITQQVLLHREEQSAHTPRLVDGYDIMSRFGLNPGPRVGHILEIVQEAYASGDITTKEEAFGLVERILSEPSEERKYPKF